MSVNLEPARAHHEVRDARRAFHVSRADLRMLEKRNRAGEGEVQNEEVFAKIEETEELGRRCIAACDDYDELASEEPQLWGDDDGADPLLLLPLRLETVYRNDGEAGLELMIRVYPDDIHIDSHDPTLTAAERAATEAYWREVWAAGPHDERRRTAWSRLVAAIGPGRAAWAAKALRPGQTQWPDTETPVGVTGPSPEPWEAEPRMRDGAWTRPANSSVLPDRLVFSGYEVDDDTRQLVLAWREEGEPIPEVLDVGPGPDSPVPPAWLTDFDEAVRVGMGVRIAIEGEMRPDYELVTVAGVRGGTSEHTADLISALLDAHRCTDGLAVLPTGTPTNNTEATRSAWRTRMAPPPPEEAGAQRAALGDSPPGEPPAAARASLALGPAAGQVLAETPDGLDGDDHELLTELHAAIGAMAAASTRWMDYDADTQVDLTFLVSHFVDHVRARGQLPTLRVGRQPYGILPVTSLDLWRGADIDQRILDHVQAFRTFAEFQSWRSPSVGRSGDADEVINDLLHRLPASRRVRFVQQVPVDPPFQPVPDSPIGTVPASNNFAWLQPPDMTIPPFPLEFSVTTEATPQLQELLNAAPLGTLFGALYEFGQLQSQHAEAPPEVLQRIFDLAPAFKGLREGRLGLWYDLAITVLRMYYTRLDQRLQSGSPVESVVGLLDGRVTVEEGTVPGIFDWAAMAMDRLAVAEVQAYGDLPRLERLLCEVLDTQSHRLDAWITSVASTRLEQVRGDRPDGTHLGAYGWVTDLRPRGWEPPSVPTDPEDDEMVDGGSEGGGEGAAEGGETEASETEAPEAEAPETEAPEGGEEQDPEDEAGQETWLGNEIPPLSEDDSADGSGGDSGGDSGDDSEEALAAAQDNDGYLVAPSMHQATTAAVLRSGWLSHTDDQAFCIDLRAGRVRKALDVVDGVRSGQTLGALLGYRLERALHDAHLDQLINAFRTGYPTPRLADPEAPDSEEARTATAARDVVDGQALIADFTAHDRQLQDLDSLTSQLSADLLPLLDQALPVVNDLEATVDAVGDLLLAESVHHLVAGNPLRAGQAADGIARGDNLPQDFEVLRTPRAAVDVTHRLGLLAPASGTEGWAADRPLAALEPALERWCQSRLGPAAGWEFAFGDPDSPTSVSLAELGVCALETVLGAGLFGNRANQGSTTLSDPDGTLARRLLRQAPADGQITEAGVQRFAELQLLCRALAEVLAAGRPLLGTDLDTAAGADWSAADLPELAARITAWHEAVTTALAELDEEYEELPDTADEVAHRLETLAGLGVAGAWPTADADQAAALGEQARAVLSRFRAEPLPPLPGPPPQEPSAVLEWVTQLRTAVSSVFGRALPVLPVLRLNGSAAATALTGPAPQGADEEAVEDWLLEMERVRPQARVLGDALAAAETLAGTAPCTAVVAQTPAGQPWIARGPAPVPSRRRPAPHHCAVLRADSAADPGEIAGLVVDAWTETVPEPAAGDPGDQEELGGLAFHYNQPDARAPQALLLALPPDCERGWRMQDVHAVVEETFALAQLRGMDLNDLFHLRGLLPVQWLRPEHGWGPL
ncbi:hypothetical protein ABZZ79_31915 [Streptomyces sp. NPDC006458]|uniref:hypothetical protein n=1 Tax=Streptomyces sp. NPDC006458 TaxID=3154302 RepID=UPI0033B4B8ED